ncbi:hypothetical protein GCM10007937_24520 [Mesorhizobium albiziae]|nr:hypothetical protein GCM10007937_24520 [Mesorhizobium albiziae]
MFATGSGFVHVPGNADSFTLYQSRTYFPDSKVARGKVFRIVIYPSDRVGAVGPGVTNAE